MSSFGPSPFSQRQGVFDSAGDNADAGIVSRFFNQVYAWMAAGLAMTAVVAWWVAQNRQEMLPYLHGGGLLALFVVQMVLVIAISAAVQKLSTTVATALFLLYAALMGVTVSGIFLIYTLSSISGTFVACAAMFGACSVYGMVTKKDLTSLGSIMFMALIGLIVASVVNIFVASSLLYWIISYAGVAIFVGLTAYDTQKLRQIAISTQSNAAMSSRLAVNGALMLYLDFLNMFVLLLRIMGDRR